MKSQSRVVNQACWSHPVKTRSKAKIKTLVFLIPKQIILGWKKNVTHPRDPTFPEYGSRICSRTKPHLINLSGFFQEEDVSRVDLGSGVQSDVTSSDNTKSLSPLPATDFLNFWGKVGFYYVLFQECTNLCILPWTYVNWFFKPVSELGKYLESSKQKAKKRGKCQSLTYEK